MEIKVADLKPNPFRQLDAYPLKPEKIAALKDSIKSTEFWDNLVARKSPDGGYELAYGHHRWRALRELRIETIDIPVRVLSDDTMLRMMAHENRIEWGASAAVEQETVRAVVEAYSMGVIALPKPGKDTPKTKLRNAPSFCQGRPSHDPCERPYTAETIHTYLGFKDDAGLNRIKDTLNALAMIETGVLRKEDVGDLSVYKVKLIQQAAKEYEHAPEVQKKVARHVAKALRDKDIQGFDGERQTRVKLEASRIAHQHHVQSKSEIKRAEKGEVVHDQDAEATKLTAALNTLTEYNATLRRVEVLVGFIEFCGPTVRKQFVGALTKLRDQINGYIELALEKA